MRACGGALLALTALVAAAAGACEKENVGTVVGPPLVATAAPLPSAAPFASASQRPATMDFVELHAKGGPASRVESITMRPCEEVLAAVTAGKVAALGEELGEGDVLVVVGAGSFELATALPTARAALLRVVPTSPCGAAGPLAKHVARGAASPELTWAGGAMRARLDVEKAISPVAYLGRLNGAAPVGEHTHPDSWELICAIDAAGTFRLSGRDARLTAGQCVAVPPGEKHQWTPDPGTSLRAVQAYVPPGPEQRFRMLAAGVASPMPLPMTGAGDGGA